MSLASNLTTAFTRVGTECKALRTLINGNAADNTALTTTAKANLVAAINEVDAAVDALVAGGTFQPSDADLTAIAALATSAYGRNFLTLANQAALVALIPTATAAVPGILPLATLAEAATGTDSTKAMTAADVRQERTALKAEILGAGVPGALDTLDELAAALGDDANYAATITTALANKQPLDADLTSIAALVSAADKMPYATGAGTWALTTVSAFARTLLDDADVATAQATLQVYSQTQIGDPATDFVAAFNAALV